MQLSIIIVNYNVKHFLEHCLNSAVKACKNIDAEIIVIDNNSTDGSKEYFADKFKQVKFIWKQQNVGFSKANNEGLKIATGEKILFLNPDTIIPEDCFEKCLAFFTTKEKIGAVGVKMIDGSGSYLQESKRGFPTFAASFCKMTGLAKMFPTSSFFSKYYLGNLNKDAINEVDILSGAFIMIDKKVLEKVGGFDEAYFMYAEDIDLSYRIQKAGYKNYYYPEVTIIHFKGESTNKQSTSYIRNFYGTMILFVKKHYNLIAAFFYSGILRIIIIIKIILNSFKKDDVKNIVLQKHPLTAVADENTLSSIKETLLKHFSSIENNSSSILLCEPTLSYKEIIKIISNTNSLSKKYYLHSQNSNSIISSLNKQLSGNTIEIK